MTTPTTKDAVLKPQLKAADQVRNLVASMRMEAVAARDGQKAALDVLVELQSAVETTRKAVEALAERVESAVDDRRTGLENANAHVHAFDQELAMMDRLIAVLEKEAKP